MQMTQVEVEVTNRHVKITPNRIVTVTTEVREVLGNKEADLIPEETSQEAEDLIETIKDNFPGAEAMVEAAEYEQNNEQYRYDYQRGRGRGSFCKPWRSHGNYNPWGRGYTLSGTGDPQYKGIPQYKYLCGICHNRGHYDHQCHTLQHLFHAMQLQTWQNTAQPSIEYDNQNQTDQQTF